MKKLLILMLVLGMASAANADLTWSVSDVTLADIGDTVDVYLVSSDATMGNAWVGADPGVPQVCDITAIAIINPGAGDDASVNDARGSYPGWWDVTSLDSSSPFNTIAGNQYLVTITALAEGTASLSSDEYGAFGTAQIGNLGVTVVPEPMTIALLGLGGLFLLRRRK